jgi:predicted metal-dependent phosphoesterase TrpH
VTVDLHLHTNVSDGIASPADVVRSAANVGLKLIAVADHDDAAGVPEAVRVGKELGVEVIPALELTARAGEKLGTVHILGYGIDPAAAALVEVARRSRVGKRAQIERMLERLAAEGVAIPPEEVGLVPGEERYIGRNRIASALVRRGLVKDRLKAFKRWLNPGGRAFAEAEVVPATDAIAAIHAAGGLAVLAHPGDEDLDRHLKPLLAAGLDGIELYRPKLIGRLLERVEKTAAKHSLLVTGGSDWHGLYPGLPLGQWKLVPDKVAPFLERVRRSP